MKRIYQFRKKIGFPVCKKEISLVFKCTGRGERALMPVLLRITHYLKSWVLVSLPNLYPPCSFPLIVPRAPSYFPLSPVSFRHKRELKQQRRRRQRKRHLKSEFALLQTLSRLLHLVYFVKCWQMFLELNSKGLYQSSGKEKKVVVLCSRPRQNVN